MITSTSNPQVKNLIQLKRKAKARREQGLFAVEGVRMFSEAPACGIEAVYVSDSFLRRPDSGELLAAKGFGESSVEAAKRSGHGDVNRSGARLELLSDTVFGYVSDTETPQGILCLMRMPEYGPGEVFGAPADPDGCCPAEGGLWLVLEGIQDPGNLGTMFRTAEGAGADGIVMDGGTVDIFNPKTIRSTMGSIWRVPFYVTDDLAGTLYEMKSCGIRLFAACGGGNVPYTGPDYTGASAFMVGNEGNGLSSGAVAEADVMVSIPMRGQLESLNASMAAGILMYEADRQRRGRAAVP